VNNSVISEGTVLRGRYRITHHVATGGMGLLYKGYDLQTSTLLAVKTPRPEMTRRPEVIERFRHEARILQRLRHDNVVPYVDFCEENGWPYLIVQWVPGDSMRERLEGRRRPFSAEEVTPWVEGLCSALSHLAQRGVVHRDVKPGNILITPGNRPVLIDFSIAITTSAGPGDEFARTSAGTAGYMAPEQMVEQAVDPRADIYSLGTVLFELLTLARPFADVERAAGTDLRRQRLLAAKSERDPPSLARYRSDLPAGVILTVDRALARRPQARWASAADLRVAWPNAQAETEGKAAEGAGKEKEKGKENEKDSTAKRRLLALVIAGAVIVAAMASVLLLGRGGGETGGGPIVRVLLAICQQREIAQGVTWTMCADSATLSPDRLQVQVSWSAEMPAGAKLIKRSDANNPNVYLLDSSGQRYNHGNVGGDAGRDVEVLQGRVLRGWYDFPAVSPNLSPVSLVDEDQSMKLVFSLR
jgi:predicted Ser/Thr protein kinase